MLNKIRLQHFRQHIDREFVFGAGLNASLSGCVSVGNGEAGVENGGTATDCTGCRFLNNQVGANDFAPEIKDFAPRSEGFGVRAPTIQPTATADACILIWLAGGMAALYHYMPNTYVKWAHAWAGGVFVAIGIAVAKKLLVVYLGAGVTLGAYGLHIWAVSKVPVVVATFLAFN